MATKRTPATPTQLPLLETLRVPAHRRLDERTRRVGLAGVAQAKAILAAQAARREARESAIDGRFVRRAA